MDFETINAVFSLVLKNLGGVIAVGLVAFALYRLVVFILAVRRKFNSVVDDRVDERMSGAVKKSLENGGGEAVRAIVREEIKAALAEFHTLVEAAITNALATHTVAEKKDLAEAFDRVKGCADKDCNQVVDRLTKLERAISRKKR